MGISIDGIVASKIGLASHQNAVPLLQQLSIANNSDDHFSDLVLELETSLPFAISKTWRFDQLEAASTISLADRDVDLRDGFLANLSESARTWVELRVRSNSLVIAEKRFPVELLARNEWGGAASMPELLAAFGTPNDPAVDKVLKTASEVLRRAGRPDGIDGYTAGSRQRVWEVASAIWSAVCGYQISYVLPPASFELQGQKVRTPSQILNGLVGTCLDTALLFAATLEQAGLNPILVLTHGHAFCGVWLQPQEFAQVLTDEAAAIRKRIDLQELLVFETTLATRSPAPGFGQALEEGKRQLSDQDFVMAVDLRRARMQKLRPLTVRLDQTDMKQDAHAPGSNEGLEAAPDLPDFDVAVAEAPATPADKLQLWQRKLLDLTTRNRLLHLPDSAKAIRLVCPDPARLEDVLADNGSVRIVPMPDLEVGGRDSQIYASRNRTNLEDEFASQAMARSEVLSRMGKEPLDAALIDLYRKARLDLEEGGSNTLFLAVGFLRWKKTEHDPKTYSAPLILLPVKLERRGILSGVKMSMLDDEPRFNLTLLELLRHDFQLNIHGLSGELPTDESGINVKQIWNIVRQAVRDMPGFEVVTEVVLGTFSFAKYLMWRDLLDRSDQLMQNEVVRHLLQHKLGGSALESKGNFPAPATLDEEVQPGELFTPLPADSSQLAAVVASARGHSFVLDGPPGTGKSQTIANMIAHNLALGRRVLFVAEKMAALDVVKRRLDEKGIGEFCLELHSSKASKVHVLQQLDRAWTSRDALTEEQWSAQAESVRALRDRLNRVVSVLHRRWPNGWTVHEAIGRVIKDAVPSTPRLSWSADAEHDQTQMDSLRDIARRLDLNRNGAEISVQIPLVKTTEWSNAWQEAIVATAHRALSAKVSCDEAISRVAKCGGLSLCGSEVATNLLTLARLLPDAYGADLQFAFGPRTRTIQTAATQAAEALQEYRSLEKRLSRAYPPESIRRIDVGKIRNDWVNASEKFWILATFAKKNVAKSLAATAGTSGLPEVAADLPILEAMKPLVTKIDELDKTLSDVPGWASLSTDSTRFAIFIRLSEGIRTALISVSASPDHLASLTSEVERLVVDANDLLAPDGVFVHAVGQLTESNRALSLAAEKFGELSGSQIDLIRDTPALLEAAKVVVDSETALHACCSWLRVRQEALARGLEPLVEAVEQGTLADGSVKAVFEVAYARWFAAKSIDAEPLLRHFVPAEHQSDIQAYIDAVDVLSELTAAYVRAKLSGTIPDKNGVSKRSGFGVLKHELQKKRRHKPVRQLAQEMGEAFTSLAPCMLMSPLSIAQYLPADYELFDLVIFDEASQIAPWDAVGSIARGRQVVVAGDPRQMPPTSFFDRGASVDEDDTDEDLESILDECIGAGVPQHSLTWHYRSHHESLITFSNYHYYGGNLITFPAADTRPSTVTWQKVDGVYARGKGRHNQVEAKAIVGEVVKRLTDADFIRSGQSIGVITLNQDQQKLVEDLLDQARRQHPSIDQYFRDELAEPVVVKNLETMQGDERDLIILGIGFGPTEPNAPAMSMNFGPLNREGGWRRLNVAVTRARREMMIFSSFDPSMIDFNRTSARAVHDLRHFIEFADKGPSAISAAVLGSVGTHESPFEQFVAEGLRAKGWETRPQIGVSRFRIDLGVVHPDRPGDFLLGVECDGATYHSAATARDRDKVRGQILARLGWKLVRVWSTEWWIDRDHALERLHQTIQSALEESRSHAAPLTTPPESTALEGSEPLDDRPPPAEELSTALVSEGKHHASPPFLLAPTARLETLEQVQQIAKAADIKEPATKRVYRKSDLSAFGNSLQPDLFYDRTYDLTLALLVRRVLEDEAPILDKALVDRVARAHGFLRSGHLIRERVLTIAKRRHHFLVHQQDRGNVFVWLNDGDSERWNAYRLPSSEADIRPLEEIAPEEILTASRALVAEDLPLEIARSFGIRRLATAGRERIVRVLGSRPLNT